MKVDSTVMTTKERIASSAVQVPDTFNIATYCVDNNLAAGRGSKAAIYEDGRELTYRQLGDLVNRCGNALRELGVQEENRILIAVPDSAEFVTAFLGAAKVGAVPVPVNTGSRPEEILYYLNDSGARVMVLHEELWTQFEPMADRALQLRHVLVVPNLPSKTAPVSLNPSQRTVPFRCQALAEVLETASPLLYAAATSKDDIAFILYTSGSTGGPKGAVHLQHDIVYATECYARGVLGMTERDVSFSASKLFFAYGLGNGMYFPFALGASAVYNPHRPKPEMILEYLERYRPTLFFGVPTLYAAIMQLDQERDLSSLRLAISAGEALPAELFNRFKERYGVSILDGIGSTEMTHIFISNCPDDIRLGSTGKLVPGYEARIVDEMGKDLPAGEIGNLLVKGDSAAAFYWRKHDKTKSTMVGEWLVTGDKYYTDSDGYFYYCGRADDMLRCAGQWVSPAEVEGALAAFPGVVEAAVVGARDSDGLTKPKAFIVMKQPPGAQMEQTAESLRTFLRGRLAPFKCPRWFEFVSELPKTATGKIQRFKLRVTG